MRTIKFRGKRVDNGEWVYGHLIEIHHSEKGTYICNYQHTNRHYEWVEIKVFSKTVGQFTRLKDKNEKEIFEGDFCKDAEGRILIVGWSDRFASFVLESKKWAFKHWFGESCEPEDIEVIGNLHDNPELL